MSTETIKQSRVISGNINRWTIDGEKVREYIVTTVPLAEFEKTFKARKFSASSGKGEQRDIIESHVRNLKNEMIAGTYTPTSASAGLTKKQQDGVKIEGDNAVVSLNEGEVVPLTDFNHRLHALFAIRDKAIKDEKPEIVENVNKLPITTLLMLDGDTRSDFVALQYGRPMDKTHMMSLAVKTESYSEGVQEYMKVALQAAKLLNETDGSPFFKKLRLDSTTPKKGVISKPMPAITLIAMNSSLVAFSLYGSAKICQNAETISYTISKLADALGDYHAALTDEGSPLAVPANNGTKASATILLAVANCLLYQMSVEGKELPEEADLKNVAKIAKLSLSKWMPAKEGTTKLKGDRNEKSEILGAFAKEYFAGMDDADLHEGVPIGLLKLTSCGCFNVTKAKFGEPEVEADATEGGEEATAPTEEVK